MFSHRAEPFVPYNLVSTQDIRYDSTVLELDLLPWIAEVRADPLTQRWSFEKWNAAVRGLCKLADKGRISRQKQKELYKCLIFVLFSSQRPLGGRYCQLDETLELRKDFDKKQLLLEVTPLYPEVAKPIIDSEEPTTQQFASFWNKYPTVSPETRGKRCLMKHVFEMPCVVTACDSGESLLSYDGDDEEEPPVLELVPSSDSHQYWEEEYDFVLTRRHYSPPSSRRRHHLDDE